MAKNSDIREWQGAMVADRDKKNLKKPSDKTILENARIVYQFYCWADRNGFPVAVNNTNKEWKYNYRNDSKLINVKSMVSGTSPDTANIDLGGKKKQVMQSSGNTLLTMSPRDISKLMKAYKDPVYPAILMLALGTGMREQGCVRMPYIGFGENGHIRPFPDIKNELTNSESKTYSFTVTEKGNNIV